MVEDHFAILKVGPWLTFAFREAVFALSAIEQELAGGKSQRLSRLREALDQAIETLGRTCRGYPVDVESVSAVRSAVDDVVAPAAVSGISGV